jgi:hypothetical protein
MTTTGNSTASSASTAPSSCTPSAKKVIADDELH